jgi:hypothetical protein
VSARLGHGQNDDAARKWEEFQHQPTGEEPQREGARAVKLATEWRRIV